MEEKRALYTRMSKYSLQLEERESYLAHQRAVDEEAVLKTSHHNAVRRSPHAHSEEVPISNTDQDSIHSETEKMPALSQSKYLRSHIEDSSHNHISSTPISSSATTLRHSGNTTGSTSTGSSGNMRVPESSESEGYNPPKTTSNRASLDLKSELNQLDSEIGKYYMFFMCIYCLYYSLYIFCLERVNLVYISLYRGVKTKIRESCNVKITANT